MLFVDTLVGICHHIAYRHKQNTLRLLMVIQAKFRLIYLSNLDGQEYTIQYLQFNKILDHILI